MEAQSAVWIKWSEDGRRVIGAALRLEDLNGDGKVERIPWLGLRRIVRNSKLAEEVINQIG